MKDKAIVLLSGGLDSSTALFIAKKLHKCHCLIFDYGQKHIRELNSAVKIAKLAGCDYKIIKMCFPWKGSSLTDDGLNIPYHPRKKIGKSVPDTYVPGRNTIFISYAVSFAEAIGAKKIYIGANAVDFSGYPDCSPQYYAAFNNLLKFGTKRGDIKIEIPLIKKTKKEIVNLAFKYSVPLKYTWSCYRGGDVPCGHCDSCVLRQEGFSAAGKKDPLL